jgi:hypothetical protein
MRTKETVRGKKLKKEEIFFRTEWIQPTKKQEFDCPYDNFTHI